MDIVLVRYLTNTSITLQCFVCILYVAYRAVTAKILNVTIHVKKQFGQNNGLKIEPYHRIINEELREGNLHGLLAIVQNHLHWG